VIKYFIKPFRGRWHSLGVRFLKLELKFRALGLEFMA